MKDKKVLTKAEKGEHTKQEILRIARKLFGTKGYSQTSTEEILEELNLSRGALYHHFTNKKDIFKEVCKDINQEIIDKIEFKSWNSLKRNWKEVLELSNEAEFVRIWIRDCYSVLDIVEVNEIDSIYFEKPLVELLEKSTKAKILKKIPPVETAQIIISMINQAIFVLAETKEEKKIQVKKNLSLTIEHFLKSLEV
ncbi:MAG: TetR/AcrR family transcriptional regulator [Leptospiraceae bacterium]|nr:TetR/AcrR family transcriptional regulator [Leptospiraceae bacterium]